MTQYIIRFDDINPNMDWEKFNQLKSIINKYKIKSILGVIPNVKIKQYQIFQKTKLFY